MPHTLDKELRSGGPGEGDLEVHGIKNLGNRFLGWIWQIPRGFSPSGQVCISTTRTTNL